MLVRYPWNDFPEVLTRTSVDAVENHPAFEKARQGNFGAARQLVRDVGKPQAWHGKIDYVCPVAEFDRERRLNALPLAVAAQLAEATGAKIVTDVVAERPAHDHRADSVARLVDQSGFAGRMPPGSYLICGDVVGFGSRLANLRGHALDQGVQVVAAVALAAHLFSSSLVPDRTVLRGIAQRFSHELSTIRETLGFDYDRLTAREAYYIYGLETLEPLRNPAAALDGAGSPAV